MAYYTPRQKTNGKWYYTCSNSAGIFDVGGCSQIVSCPDCSPYYLNYDQKGKCKTCLGHGFIDKVDPCQGHDTPEEAVEHYRQYNVINAKTGFSEDEQRKCEICEKWTQHYMAFKDFFKLPVYLCEEHLTHEYLNKATSPKKKNDEK